MKWYEDLGIFIFNVIFLTVLLWAGDLELVVVYGFAKILTEIWKREVNESGKQKETYKSRA